MSGVSSALAAARKRMDQLFKAAFALLGNSARSDVEAIPPELIDEALGIQPSPAPLLIARRATLAEQAKPADYYYAAQSRRPPPLDLSLARGAAAHVPPAIHEDMEWATSSVAPGESELRSPPGLLNQSWPSTDTGLAPPPFSAWAATPPASMRRSGRASWQSSPARPLSAPHMFYPQQRLSTPTHQSSLHPGYRAASDMVRAYSASGEPLWAEYVAPADGMPLQWQTRHRFEVDATPPPATGLSRANTMLGPSFPPSPNPLAMRQPAHARAPQVLDPRAGAGALAERFSFQDHMYAHDNRDQYYANHGYPSLSPFVPSSD